MLKKIADRFFSWYCHPDYYEDIKGDLEEIHHQQLSDHSDKKAARLYAREVLLLFRPSIIRPIGSVDILHLSDMLRNYFKIGFRYLNRHRFYTLIHVLGLALGLTAFLLINEYNSFEKSYDDFHEKSDQLYRLTTDMIADGEVKVRDAMCYAPAGKVLQTDLPEVIGATTTEKLAHLVFKKDGQAVVETGTLGVDSNFLNLFNYQLISGDKETALTEPYTLVLSQKIARKYFGNEDAVGKTIELVDGFNRPFKVTGILKNIPENTHYGFDILMSISSRKKRLLRSKWQANNYYCYLRLVEGVDPDQVRKKLPALSKKHMGKDSNSRFSIQLVKDIHLNSDYTYEPQIHGSAKAVYFLGIISLFILLIAWINYINLSTARAMSRAKEVGLRKIVGAKKIQLIGQFFTESILVNFLGAIFALIFAQLALPYFNTLIGKTILTEVWSQPSFMKNLSLFFLLGTLVTGLYPAMLLSSFRPIVVLRGAFSRTKQGAWLRKGLVVFQFAASLILIAATLIVYQQIRFMLNTDMGINPSQVITVNNPRLSLSKEEYSSKYKTFTQTILAQTGVSQSGSMLSVPGGTGIGINSFGGEFQILGINEMVEGTIYYNRMNSNAQDVLEFELLAGRNFTKKDSAVLIVNMALLKFLGISNPEEAINQLFKLGGEEDADRIPIVGVIKDYNRSSLKSAVEPSIFHHIDVTENTIIRLEGGDIKGSIAAVEKTWREFYPTAVFNYSFLDDRFAKLYAEDEKFGSIFASFSVLAIIVALLGLFGLSSYLSLQRSKEVGIRKVLGASSSNIVFLFFKDFLWLILIAVVVGTPLVFWSMSQWLNGYAFRIDFPWWVIGASLLAVILLAFFTVSWQIYRIAKLNPSETIRHE